MQQKTPPAATRGGSTRREDGTRRLLNLLFALSVASEPLTTDRIIDDPEIGYSGRERESRVKAFNRDRDTLAGLGVYIREAAAYSDAKNEQRRWEIDRRSTHADGTALSPYDAQEAIAAIDQLFSLHAADPARWPLQMARAKLCKIAGIDPEATHVEQGHAAADLAHVWSAFVRRRPATFVYRDARGEERTHIVDLYGMFERGTQVYLVGNDHDANDLRTFRTDRIVSAKKAAGSSKPYRIPAEFDVSGFQFLPFDFSRNDPVKARFSFAPGCGMHEIELITRGRGSIATDEQGAHDWIVDVRDLDAAASFALEHAHLGIRACEPAELVERIATRKEQAVIAHGR